MDVRVTFSSFVPSLPIPLHTAIAFPCGLVCDHLSWHLWRRGACSAPVRLERFGGPQWGVLSLSLLRCMMKCFIFGQGKRAAKLKPDALNLPCRVCSPLSCSGVGLVPSQTGPFLQGDQEEGLGNPLCLCRSTKGSRGHPMMSSASLEQRESFCWSADPAQSLNTNKAQNEESCAYPLYQSQVQH